MTAITNKNATNYKPRHDIQFEESIFDELLEIADRMVSVQDKRRVYALVWALKNYLITKRKREGFGE